MTGTGSAGIIEVVKAVTIILATAVAAAGSTYSAPQLGGIVDPKPALPGWSFTKGKPYLFPAPRHSPSFTLSEFIGASPSSGDRAFAAKLAGAGFLVGRHEVWDALGRHQPAKLVVFALLFRTAAGAAKGVRVLPANAGTRVTGLGTEAWRLDSRSGVVYLWRRGNLVVYAGLDCRSVCASPPAGPARTYADELDARAKRAA